MTPNANSGRVMRIWLEMLKNHLCARNSCKRCMAEASPNGSSEAS